MNGSFFNACEEHKSFFLADFTIMVLVHILKEIIKEVRWWRLLSFKNTVHQFSELVLVKEAARVLVEEAEHKVENTLRLLLLSLTIFVLPKLWKQIPQILAY